MGKKSKLFRVFVAGNTISDGRTITPEMIGEIVDTFNAETYTPRINIEHLSGFSPEPPFNGYGDVIAVEARDVELSIAGKTETRRALYAQIEANDQLVKLFARDQKPFPSVELTPAYAGVEKIGLVGLAFTDKPASIGTERAKFSRSAPGTFFAVSDEAPSIEFEAEPQDAAGMGKAIGDGIVAAFSKLFGAKNEPAAPPPPPPPAPPAANDNDFAAIAAAMGETFAAAIKPIADAQAKTAADFAELKASLEKQPDTSFSRPPATGGSGAGGDVTDC